MAFNVPASTGMPDEGDIKDMLKKQVEESVGLVDNLVEWSNSTDKDEFEAKLMQVRPNDWKEFWGTDGQINRDYLAENLTTKEKFSLLASHLIGDQILSIFFPEKDTSKVHNMTMDEATEFFKNNPDKGGRRVGEHLVWDYKNPFSQLTTLFSLADMAKETSTEGQESFPLVPGTFWFINPGMPTEAGPKLRPTMYSVLKRACARSGIELSFVRPGERVTKPGPKEIALSFLPTKSVPLKSDGEIDYDLLDWYVSLYDQAPWMLMQGSPLLAAIHVRTRDKSADTATRVQEALGPDYANMKDANFAASLQTILPFPDVPGATPAAATPAAPAAAAQSTTSTPAATPAAAAPATPAAAAPAPTANAEEPIGESNPDEVDEEELGQSFPDDEEPTPPTSTQQ